MCSLSRNSPLPQMFFGKERLCAGIGIGQTHQKSAGRVEDGGLSERRERIVSIPNWDSNMMKNELPILHGTCLDKAIFPSIWEGSDLMRTPNDEVLKSSASLGCVLIVSRDHFIRDFLGQIVKLLGYECEYLEELPNVMKEQPWKGFDALFIESHALEHFKRGMGHGSFSVPGSPLVVVLGDLPLSDETGYFRVLKKPLDYRQMGRVMDECLSLKTQRHASQGD